MATLGDGVVALVAFLVFERNRDCVEQLQVRGVMGQNLVILDGCDVALANRVRTTLAKHLKVFTTAHGKEEPEEEQLMKHNHDSGLC